MNIQLPMLVSLGDMVSTQKGFAFKSGWFGNDGVPIVKVSDFTFDSIDVENLVRIPSEIAAGYGKYMLCKGDVVLQTVGSWPTNPASVVGKCVRVPVEAHGSLLNQNAVKLDPCQDLDKLYLYYRLRSEDFKSYIIATAQGAASQAAITLEAIRAYSFELPPLEEQRRIAGILSTYDDLIENCQRRIKILEEMARSLYREWFVHFRYPGHESIPLRSSSIGCIPSDWKVMKLGQVLELVYGKALKQEDRHGGDIPVYGSSGVVGYHDVALAKGPGIIVGRKGNVGSVFWCESDFYVIDTAYYVASELPLRYLFYTLPRLNFLNNDAAVPGLSRQQAYALEIPLPTGTLVEKFTHGVEPFEQEAELLHKQIENLQQTRDLLLPRLVGSQNVPV